MTQGAGLRPQRACQCAPVWRTGLCRRHPWPGSLCTEEESWSPMLPQGTATPPAVPLPPSRGPPWTLMMTWMSPGQGCPLLAAPQNFRETLTLLRLQGQGCERVPPPRSSGPQPRFTMEDLDGARPPRVSPGTDDGGLADVASVAPTGSEGSRLCMTGNNRRRPLPCDARIPRSQIPRPQLKFTAAAMPVGSVFQARTEETGREPEAPTWLGGRPQPTRAHRGSPRTAHLGSPQAGSENTR